MTTSFITHGIDVSKWQGEIDWEKVAAAGVDFAYVRASHGAKPDGRAAANIDGALEAGLMVGAYHYLESGVPVDAQVEAFLGVLGDRDLQLLPVLDVEDEKLDPAKCAIDCLRWLDEVQEHHDEAPMLYTMPEAAARLHLERADLLKGFPLWVAHWGAAKPLVPKPWGTWACWQHSNKGRVAGITGDVDLNIGMGLWG